MEPSTSREHGSCPQEQTGSREWNPKHKIFLSHSRTQKEFVRQLCKDLEAETHAPFFDERSSSLMMGEPFAPVIFEAAKQCLVAVVVLSEEFLTSKWPMLELVEFVKAKKSHNPELKLFPLFYKLSPDDLKAESFEKRWKNAWANFTTTRGPHLVMAANDTRKQLDLRSCTEAIRELRGSNGLRFENYFSEVSYREAIVKEISLLVPPELLDDTSDVIGKERLCEVVAGMFVEDTSEDSNLRGTQKLGLYGVGGHGKTTLSRALCMFLRKRFNGRVFHVELGTMPALELQKLVLTKLLRISKDVVERVHNVHEGRYLLKEHMSRQPVFLVIDNITQDPKFRTEALAYLEAGFQRGSMIMITSRSCDIVKELFPDGLDLTYCKAVASLSEEEAGFVFLRRAAPQRKLESLTIEEREILKVCVRQGCFLSVDGEWEYHPLALQALADYYHRHDIKNLVTWEEDLGDLDKLRGSDATSEIFDVLGLQFRTLGFRRKLLFLDVCLYTRKVRLSGEVRTLKEVISWLADVHEVTPTVVEKELRGLKRSDIINISHDGGGDQFISIHDLYKEFAKWYLIDGEGGAELGCVYHTSSATSLPYVLKSTRTTPSEWRRIRLAYLECIAFPLKKVQEWCNVVVLLLFECSKLKVLYLHGLSCLRRLSLVWLYSLESFHLIESESDSSRGSNGTVESLQHVVLLGLESLKELPDFSLCRSLKSFQMGLCKGPEPPSFIGCSQLEDLDVIWQGKWRSGVFELNTLTSLTSLQLLDFSRSVISSDIARHRALEYGDDLKRLELVGLDACTQLQTLSLRGLGLTSLPGLEKLTKLRSLTVEKCRFLRDIPDLSALAVLDSLELEGIQVERIAGVERLQQLRTFICLTCTELMTLPDLDHLPNLTRVIIAECPSLKNEPRVPLHCATDVYEPMLDI